MTAQKIGSYSRAERNEGVSRSIVKMQVALLELEAGTNRLAGMWELEHACHEFLSWRQAIVSGQ